MDNQAAKLVFGSLPASSPLRWTAQIGLRLLGLNCSQFNRVEGRSFQITFETIFPQLQKNNLKFIKY